MVKKAVLCKKELRQTLEYEAATYYVQLRMQAYAQLRAIDKELQVLRRLSPTAVALAKEDVQ